MKFSKVVIPLLCVFIISIGLNFAQFISRRIEFRQASERFMVQINNDIWDANTHLDNIITGTSGTYYQSPELLQALSLQLNAIHSLISSNDYLFDVYWGFQPDFRETGRFLYSGGIMNGLMFPGILSDGVVSENELMFLKALEEILAQLKYNACLDIRLFNQRLDNLKTEWEALPFHLLASG